MDCIITLGSHFLWLYEPLLKERAPAVISGLSNKSGSCGRGKKNEMKCGKREQRTAVAGAFSDEMRMISRLWQRATRGHRQGRRHLLPTAQLLLHTESAAAARG